MTRDLSEHHMVARDSGRGLWIVIRPDEQGQVAVGDTIILSDGEAYHVTDLDAPYTTRKGVREVRVSLERIA